MKAPATDEVPVIETENAHWGWHDHEYWGHAVFGELLLEEDLAGLFSLAACGHRVPREDAALLTEIAICLVLADPRIWPLKLTKLVASHGRVSTSALCGLLALDGSVVGPAGIQHVGFELERVAALVERHDDAAAGRLAVLERVRDVGRVPGFGVAFREQDERVLALERCVAKRRRTDRPYWKSMQVLVDVVREVHGVEPNVALPIAAALLDMGVPPQRFEALASLFFHHMFVSSAYEEAHSPHEVLRKLPDVHVRYVGRPRRRLDSAPPRQRP